MSVSDDAPVDVEALRAASEAGDASAMCALGRHLMSAGDAEAAVVWWRRAADLGDVDAMVRLGSVLRGRDEFDEALVLFERAAAAGDAAGAANVGWILQRRGDLPGAREWYGRAADGGNVWAMRRLGRLLRESGDVAAALRSFDRAAATGDPDSALMAGMEHYAAGDAAAAEPLLRRGLEADAAEASYWLGRIEEDRGNLDAALVLFERACPQPGGAQRAFQSAAMAHRALVLRRQGDADGYAQWMATAALAGSAFAEESLAEDAVAAGEWDEAEQRFERLSARGDRWATWALGLTVELRGDDARARALMQAAADAGYEDTALRARARARRVWWIARYGPLIVLVALVGAVAGGAVAPSLAAVGAVVATLAIWAGCVRAIARGRYVLPAGFGSGLMIRGGSLFVACLLVFGALSAAVGLLALALIVVVWVRRVTADWRVPAAELPAAAVDFLAAHPDVSVRRLPTVVARLNGASATVGTRRRILLSEQALKMPSARLVLMLARMVARIRLGTAWNIAIGLTARLAPLVGGISLAAALGALDASSTAEGTPVGRALVTTMTCVLVIDAVVEPLVLACSRRLALRTERRTVEITPDRHYALLQLRYGGGRRPAPRLYHALSSPYPGRDALIRLGRAIETPDAAAGRARRPR